MSGKQGDGDSPGKFVIITLRILLIIAVWLKEIITGILTVAVLPLTLIGLIYIAIVRLSLFVVREIKQMHS